MTPAPTRTLHAVWWIVVPGAVAGLLVALLSLAASHGAAGRWAEARFQFGYVWAVCVVLRWMGPSATVSGAVRAGFAALVVGAGAALVRDMVDFHPSSRTAASATVPVSPERMRQ